MPNFNSLVQFVWGGGQWGNKDKKREKWTKKLLLRCCLGVVWGGKSKPQRAHLRPLLVVHAKFQPLTLIFRGNMRGKVVIQQKKKTKMSISPLLIGLLGG